MSEIFISYARSTEAQAKRIAEALRSLGYGVWRDDQIPAHEAFGRFLEERLAAAKVVLVLWSNEAAQSEWVRSEASRARAMGKLVQLTLDGSPLPMPFDQIQCADLAGWTGDSNAAGWRKIVASIADLIGGPARTAEAPTRADPPLPDKPSIAVLPFINLSGDPEQEYFADGMVEEITTVLSRFRSLFVIGSASGLSFKGRAVAPQEVARQLGVRYVLEGSVRKGPGRVRIAVKLIDGSDGSQIWADRFEDTLEDVFALQDKVAVTVAGIIEPAVREADIRHAVARPTVNAGAHDLAMQGLAVWRRFSRADVAAALEILDRLFALDPNHALGLAMAAGCHAQTAAYGWSDDPEHHRRRAKAFAARALEHGRDDAEVLATVATSLMMVGGSFAESADLTLRATQLNPGASVPWMIFGMTQVWAGELDKARECLELSLRLDPFSPYETMPLWGLGLIHFFNRRFSEAAPLIRRSIQLRPNFPPPYPYLAAAYGQLGRIAEAREALARYRALSGAPAETLVSAYVAVPDHLKLVLDGLALAKGPDPSKPDGDG